MRVGVFGGVFDPVHRGHIEPVWEARDALDLSHVLYVPTGTPPHKPDRKLAPEDHRLAMLELALAEEPWAEIWRGELRSGGAAADEPSYTVRTLERLRRDLPGDELFLLVGADAFAGLRTWREWRAIPLLATLAVMHRPEAGDDRAPLDGELERFFDDGTAVRVPVPPVDVSSTRIRRAIAGGVEPSLGDLPEPVIEYIRQHGLYR